MKSKLLQVYILVALFTALLGGASKVNASDPEWEKESEWWGRPVFSSGIPVGDLRCEGSYLILHPDFYNDSEIKALKSACHEKWARVRQLSGHADAEIEGIKAEWNALEEQLRNLKNQRVEGFYSNILKLPESLESAQRESITTLILPSLILPSITLKTKEDVDAIIGLLPFFPNLTLLSLSGTRIGPLVIYFMESIPVFLKLTRFDLVKADINDELMKALLLILPEKFPALKLITMFETVFKDKDSLISHMRADERISFSIIT